MHTQDNRQTQNKFIISIILTGLILLAEIIGGIWSGSLALLSDAGHNLSDVVSLILALIAFKLMYSKATQSYTYGYKKVTVLVALLNALILFAAVGGIIFEAVFRFSNPQPLQGKVMAIVAFIGIIINRKGLSPYTAICC